MDWRCLRRVGESYPSSIVDLAIALLFCCLVFWYGNFALHPALDLYAKNKAGGTR